MRSWYWLSVFAVVGIGKLRNAWQLNFGDYRASATSRKAVCRPRRISDSLL